MNFKVSIGKLRIPRLLLESILVFGSVYLALILEANRSRDFELQNAKETLEIIQGKIQLENAYIQSYYLEAEGDFQNLMLKRDSVIYQCLLQGRKIPEKFLSEIENGDFLMFENLNTWDQSEYISAFLSRYSQYTSNHELINEFNNYHKFKSMNNRWWNFDLDNLKQIESVIFDKFILGKSAGPEIENFMMNSPAIVNAYKNHLYRMDGRLDRAKRIHSKTELIIDLIDKEIIALEDQIDGISY